MPSEEADDILRNIAEKLPPSCGIKKLPLSWRIRRFSLRVWIGRKLLAIPKRNGGILVQVDLSRKTKEEVEEFHTAIKHLRRAGIGFDTGYGGMYDMEFDWSLRGAYAKCKRCGYSSEEDRILLDNKKVKEHFVKPCDACGKELDSNTGHWHFRKHFWNKMKHYHTDCWNQVKKENY